MSSLTEFDREVLSVLMSSGGWNASARSRLAQLAKRYGVSAAGLSRVAAGLADAARDGRLQAQMAGQLRTDGRTGRQGRRAGTSDALPLGSAPGAMTASVVAVPSSAGISRGDAILLGIVAGLLLLSIALTVTLGLMVWTAIDQRRDPMRDRAAPTAAPDGPSLARDGAPIGSGFNGASASATATPGATAPSLPRPAPTTPGAGASAARPPTVPVSYPKVPTFRATLASLDLDQALANARSAAFALETLVAEAPDDRSTIRAWIGAQESVGRTWPRLDAVTRRAILERSVAFVRRIEDAEFAEACIEPLRAAIAAPPDSVGAIWRGAWSAGLIGSLLSEPGLAPEVVAVIARSRLAPADGSGDAFDRFAAAWLDQQCGPITALVQKGSPQEDFDRFEAWLEAQSRVRSGDEAQGAWLRAIDALLQRPLRFDLPGTAPDLLGRMLAQLDWSAAGTGSGALAKRFEQWMNDSAMPSPRLWALGSIVQQAGLAPWFTGRMIVGERATTAERGEALAQIVSALGPTTVEMDAFARLPREMVARWDRLASLVMTGGESAGPVVVPGAAGAAPRAGAAAPSLSDSALRDAALLLRLIEVETAGAMLRAGRSTDASQRLAELESAASKPLLAGLGPGGRSLPIPAEPSGDGLMARRLDEVKVAAERVDAIRRRRTESAPDLGPIDAARLVREAYAGEPNAVRLTAQGVIVDSFASGRRVAQELVDQFALSGGGDPALARFVERLTGERLPPHTHPTFRATALAALLRHRLRLAEHAWHGVDALTARSALSAAERLDIEGGSSEAYRDAAEPTAAIESLADLLRARAGSRIASQPFPDSLDRLDRRNDARRALADDAPQRLVAALWHAFEMELYLAAADRPLMRPSLAKVLDEAQQEASIARSVLEQAGAVQRARVRLMGTRLAHDSGGGA